MYHEKKVDLYLPKGYSGGPPLTPEEKEHIRDVFSIIGGKILKIMDEKNVEKVSEAVKYLSPDK